MNPVKLKSNGYKTAIKNKEVVNLIDRIIASSPLSYVNIERLRKEVDNLNEMFWMKDANGKYLLVNNNFASRFHLTPSQIEGKPVEKFIPAYLVNFNKALTEYVQESKNVFIIEGLPLSGAPAGEDYQIIEIPVHGVEDNLNAIIGISQQISIEEKQDSYSAPFKLLKSLLKSFIVINKENKIKDVSEEFCNAFSLKRESLVGKNYKSESSGIPLIISRVIDDFVEKNDEFQSSKFNVPVNTQNDFNLFLVKDNENRKLIFFEINNPANDELQNSSGNNSFDLFLKLNPEPVFIYDKNDLKFLNANEAALNLYGYRKDEFLQLDLTDLYSPEDIQTLLENSEEKFKEGIFSKPHKQKRKDGKNIFAEINRSSINYKNSSAYLNIVKDLTGRMNLDLDKQNFEALFNSTKDLIFITDKDGIIESVNDSVLKILGNSEQNYSGISFASLVKNDERGRINTSVFQSGKKEKLAFNTTLKNQDSEYLDVNLISAPILNSKKEIESYIMVCTPAQEKTKEIIKEVIKEIPAEIKSENTSVPEVNFLSGVFHDLLTPINVILGFVQDLTENLDEVSPEQQEALEIINHNKKELLELSNQVLEFIQIEKGQVTYSIEQIKIIDVIEQLKINFEKQELHEKREVVFGKISSSLEAEVDKEKILRFLNLVAEISFRTTSEKILFISTATYDEKHFAICIKDNANKASDILIKILSRIFSNEKTKISGIPSFTAGLTKNILSLLSGRFEVIEETDISEVMFVFPFEFKNIKEKEQVDNSPSLKDEINSQPEFGIISDYDDTKTEKDTIENIDEINKDNYIDFSQLSCLYIEDQLDSQMLFSMQMKDLKEIDFAISMEQAVPLLRSKNYDFIVVDINLQGDYNGLDILKIVRTMPEYENIPVIAVTAYILPVNKDVYVQAGFNDFISKPVLRDGLNDSLERILIPQS